MTADVYSREQRLRKQAELQSLYTNLASLREREASYIQFNTTIPELLANQIMELRQHIVDTEKELVALGDETLDIPVRHYYRDAFAAEVAGDTVEALRLYKSASRHTHPDAGAALRSIRYKVKANQPSGGGSLASSRVRFGVGLAMLLIIIVALIFLVSGRFASQTPPAVAVEPTSTPTASEVILIVPDTATPTPTNTPTHTSTPTPTDTPVPTPTEEPATETPTPTPTLKPAPIIIGPKDGLVWEAGTIVFEFQDMDLAFNELYCLDTLRGFDQTNTENWSHPPQGKKRPSIPIEASVFKIAKVQGIECIIWTASIGVDSCDNIISKSTEPRVIGLPRVCNVD